MIGESNLSIVTAAKNLGVSPFQTLTKFSIDLTNNLYKIICPGSIRELLQPSTVQKNN